MKIESGARAVPTKNIKKNEIERESKKGKAVYENIW